MLSLGPLGPIDFFEIVILLLQLVPISATGWCLLAPSQHTLAIFSLSNIQSHNSGIATQDSPIQLSCNTNSLQ